MTSKTGREWRKRIQAAMDGGRYLISALQIAAVNAKEINWLTAIINERRK